MEYNLWPLVGAVILLCLPSYLFFNSRIRRRVTESQPAGGFPLRGILLTWQNWLDVVRGYAGAFLLYHDTYELDRESEVFFQEFGAVAGILALALLLNTCYRRRYRLFCIAPVFLVCGINMVLFEWWMVLYGVVAGLVLGRISGSPEVYLITAGVVLGAFGYFFTGLQLTLLLACALTILPIVYAFTTKRGLSVASIRGSGDEWGAGS